MIRENSRCSHSDRGALTQSVLMTVLRTLRVRGHQPMDCILKALTTYSAIGGLPNLPPSPGRLRHTGEDGMVVPDAPSDESFSSFGSG